MDLTRLTAGCQQDCVPFRGSKEKSVSRSLFQLLEASRMLWLLAPASILKASNVGLGPLQAAISLLLSLLPPPFHV